MSNSASVFVASEFASCAAGFDSDKSRPSKLAQGALEAGDTEPQPPSRGIGLFLPQAGYAPPPTRLRSLLPPSLPPSPVWFARHPKSAL